MSEARGVQPAGDWFAAEVNVPQDVAVLNFVIQYYEHYDNNYGLDFKAAVEVDSEGRSVALSRCCYCHRVLLANHQHSTQTCSLLWLLQKPQHARMTMVLWTMA